MAKVYEFPVKKELPDHMKQRLDKIAKAYVELLNDVYDDITRDVTDETDLSELTEIMLVAYFDAIEKAIEELDEG